MMTNEIIIAIVGMLIVIVLMVAVMMVVLGVVWYAFRNGIDLDPEDIEIEEEERGKNKQLINT